MTRTDALTSADFLALAQGRRGHFALESGHHGALWLDLDPLFADPRRVAPFIDDMIERMRAYDVDAVCGPLLGGAFLAQRVAESLGVEFWYTTREMPSDASGLYRARYRLPSSLATRCAGRRVAMVDDVMSAGSALRGTWTELCAHGAEPVVAGALMVLGTAGEEFFRAQGVAVEAVTREAYELWTPETCPMCAAARPLEQIA